MTKVFWLERAADDLPPTNDWLSTGEANHLKTLRFTKRRTDWLLGRWTAKRAIAAYLHQPPLCEFLASIEIRPASSGAPEAWFNETAIPVTISISHSDSTALCAVASRGVALGCDIEIAEPRSECFLTDYFTKEEQALVEATAANHRSVLVTLLWSGKESALKALAKGLHLDTRSVVVSFSGCGLGGGSSPGDFGFNFRSGEPWRALHVTGPGRRAFSGWWRSQDNFVRTLVSDPAPEAPICLDPGANSLTRGPAVDVLSLRAEDPSRAGCHRKF